jgi:asparagine synthase (glutamine-hydrolysing)
MCGIAGGVGIDMERANRGIKAIRHRGPDAMAVMELGATVLAHARLSIQDVDSRSDQPFEYGNTVVAYNGELWNAPALRAEMMALGSVFTTTGDTEVIAAAIDTWGEACLPKLDGMFAVAWVRNGETWIARDRFGEVPLHWSPVARVFASEMKAMAAMGVRDWTWLEPGTCVRLDTPAPISRRWYEPSAEHVACTPGIASSLLRSAIADGCARRTVADVPVCTLLSGGIDSSAVAFHLAKHLPGLVAYTAVMDTKSRDLRCAREVAEMLGIELREVVVAPPTADDLGEIVRLIEQPHKAQVEIGWACLALARAMQRDGFKVTFSGEGSDELWASYGLSYHGIEKRGWHEYRKELFVAQHRKNFARCNKIFMAHGVECRLPFLEVQLVELALSLGQDVVVDGSNLKAVMSRAYAGDLPDEVCVRPKVAFQDGMKLKDAAAAAVGNPKRYYGAEFTKAYGDRKP